MELKFWVFLQCSQESSLPVSRTMVTLCGGEPTVSVTVKVTLWWKEILLVGFSRFGAKPCGSVWVLRGNMSVFCVAQRETWVWFIIKKIMR